MPPRRPKGVSGPAKSGTFSSSYVDPSENDTLKDFLRGAVVADAADADDEKNSLVVCLRNLSKKNVTTKQKALNDLHEAFETCDDSSVISVLPNWVEQYQSHTHHEEKYIRLWTQRVMSAFMRRGKEVKVHLGPYLDALVSSMILCMHDVDQDVRAAATEAWGAAFIPAKRDVAIERCAKALFDKSVQLLSEIRSKALKDDFQDREANLAHCAIGALGHLCRCVVAFQPEICSLVSDRSCVMRFRLASNGDIDVSATPRVRAKLLCFLADVTEKCPLSPAQRRLVDTILHVSVFDNDVDVAVSAWRLLLLSAKLYGPTLASSFQGDVFAQKIASLDLSASNSATVEAFVGSLAPFYAAVLKHASTSPNLRSEIVRDFSATAFSQLLRFVQDNVAKLHLVSFLTCWKALCSCWDVLSHFAANSKEAPFVQELVVTLKRIVGASTSADDTSAFVDTFVATCRKCVGRNPLCLGVVLDSWSSFWKEERRPQFILSVCGHFFTNASDSPWPMEGRPLASVREWCESSVLLIPFPQCLAPCEAVNKALGHARDRAIHILDCCQRELHCAEEGDVAHAVELVLACAGFLVDAALAEQCLKSLVERAVAEDCPPDHCQATLKVLRRFDAPLPCSALLIIDLISRCVEKLRKRPVTLVGIVSTLLETHWKRS